MPPSRWHNRVHVQNNLHISRLQALRGICKDERSRCRVHGTIWHPGGCAGGDQMSSSSLMHPAQLSVITRNIAVMDTYLLASLQFLWLQRLAPSLSSLGWHRLARRGCLHWCRIGRRPERIVFFCCPFGPNQYTQVHLIFIARGGVVHDSSRSSFAFWHGSDGYDDRPVS